MSKMNSFKHFHTINKKNAGLDPLIKNRENIAVFSYDSLYNILRH